MSQCFSILNFFLSFGFAWLDLVVAVELSSGSQSLATMYSSLNAIVPCAIAKIQLSIYTCITRIMEVAVIDCGYFKSCQVCDLASDWCVIGTLWISLSFLLSMYNYPKEFWALCLETASFDFQIRFTLPTHCTRWLSGLHCERPCCKNMYSLPAPFAGLVCWYGIIRSNRMIAQQLCN